MNWEELDWHVLDRLRQHFLRGSAAEGPYWSTAADLANYDFTYGARIAWKWDHVLRESRLRGWHPAKSVRTVFDWGCGSGVAARRVLTFFGAEAFDALTVWDHSSLACDFAVQAARQSFPSLQVDTATPALLASTDPIGLLIVSHVLNELSPVALAELQVLIQRAAAVIWVEPGTRAVSRQLADLHADLRTIFSVVAPCTHAQSCPMLAPENERHWCHFFAPPPAEIFANSHWVKFGQRAGIDLRSLPYAFLALDRTQPKKSADGYSRVIGRVEHFKPYARLLNCDDTGLQELELAKRADPTLFKQLERSKAPLVYRWQREGAKLLGGEALTEPVSAAAPPSSPPDDLAI
jgi:Mitochondrial small ribosomal subunit Rsm22